MRMEKVQGVSDRTATEDTRKLDRWLLAGCRASGGDTPAAPDSEGLHARAQAFRASGHRAAAAGLLQHAPASAITPMPRALLLAHKISTGLPCTPTASRPKPTRAHSSLVTSSDHTPAIVIDRGTFLSSAKRTPKATSVTAVNGRRPNADV